MAQPLSRPASSQAVERRSKERLMSGGLAVESHDSETVHAPDAHRKSVNIGSKRGRVNRNSLPSRADSSATRLSNTSRPPSRPHSMQEHTRVGEPSRGRSSASINPMIHTSRDSLSTAKLMGALNARIEHVEDITNKLSRAVADIDARVPAHKSLTRQAIDSLRRVVSSQHDRSGPSARRHRADGSRSPAWGVLDDDRYRSRIPRPVAGSLKASISQPMMPMEGMPTPAEVHRRSVIATATTAPAAPSSLQYLYGETKTHERYAKSWAIAASHAADRAGEHQKLALTAVKAFSQLLDDMLKDPQLTTTVYNPSQQN